MKIIVVTENLRPCNKSEAGALIEREQPAFMLKADSSLLKEDKPLFLPDDSEGVSVGLHLVVRISRLGKSIPERFARRYYDAVTVGLDARLDGLAASLLRQSLPQDVATSFDGAAVIGRFLPVEEVTEPWMANLYEEANLATTVDASKYRWTVDSLIAHASRHFMLRQGDFLFCGATAPRQRMSIDRHLRAMLGEHELFSFKVK